MSENELFSWENFYASGKVSEYPDVRVVRYFKSRPGPHNEVVLDLGCGNGRNAIAIAKMGYRVLAVDRSTTALRLLADERRKQRVSNPMMAVACDLRDPTMVGKMPRLADKASYVLIYGVLDYFSASEALMLLHTIRQFCWKGAKLLIAARGELDFSYDNPNRSDGFMELHRRNAEDWTIFFEVCQSWGGRVTVDSRLETFQSIPVGGVSGVLLKEHLLFIEAEAL